MLKRKKFAGIEAIELHLAEGSGEPLDPDELQLQDESNSHWVGAWKKAASELARQKRRVTHRPKRV
jgi:hypothetical protein